MTWKKPIFPQQLSKGFIVSNFTRRRKRELGETVNNICLELDSQYRSIPWNTLAMRDLVKMKLIKNFDKDSFEQMFSEAREVVNNDCAKLAEQCLVVRDKLLEIEKDEEDDGKGTKQLLIDISGKAELLAQQLNTEPIEEHIQELYDNHIAHLNKQLELRFKQLKEGIAKIVKEIKKVVELDFDAGSETGKVNGALTYGYMGVHPILKDYKKYLEKGLGDTDAETFEEELEPLFKFASDDSVFTSTMENDELERDVRSVVDDGTDSEDVKKHCIAILQAVRALPGKYKE